MMLFGPIPKACTLSYYFISPSLGGLCLFGPACCDLFMLICVYKGNSTHPYKFRLRCNRAFGYDCLYSPGLGGLPGSPRLATNVIGLLNSALKDDLAGKFGQRIVEAFHFVFDFHISLVIALPGRFAGGELGFQALYSHFCPT